ncbi:hypothetical protein [Pseudomonas sp. GD03696]|uniref:hypothetical protein n=1 Tax=Pseudomonas sp. GD03696 TaxID=2975368 RepID=UPI0024475CD9|nr:hypothetical protein [Pseudomonas sp. GD03696]MDH1930475.1 hypothetical protein [Pseudomonas sp. GD03696]
MNSINAKQNFESFLESLVPLFEEFLLAEGKVDIASKYKIPSRMMEKGATGCHAYTLPPSLPLDNKALIGASVNEEWTLLLKLANLSRLLAGNKSSKDISIAFYYLLKSMPDFKMPWEVVNSDFIRASTQSGLTSSQHYRVGAGLSCIGKFYNKYGLSPENIRYTQNSHLRPERSEKSLLPDLESCRVLAASFSEPRDHFDTLVTSAFALLNYAPSRASEIVTLDINCITDLDGFGLRFPSPAKNGDAVVKRAPCVEFEEIVRVAVDRLKEVSQTVRKVSEWYRVHPGELFIPEHLTVLRGKTYYKPVEALAIIGFRRSDALSCMQLHPNRPNSPLYYSIPPGLSRFFEGDLLFKGGEVKVPVQEGAVISKDSLLDWICSHFNSTFPNVDGVSNVRYEDSAFIYPFSSRYPSTKILWQCDFVPDFFSTSKLQMHFSRLFFRSIGREELSLRTHAMRHLLNTLAQTKHIDQRIIAMWSGRSSVSQNADYDHRSLEEKTESVDVDLMSFNYEFGGFLNDLYKSEYETQGVSTEQFFQEVVGSLHVTELGFCRHNYVSGPCPNVFQCGDCAEHCFTKSERARIAANKMIQKLAPVVELARIAVANCEPGADKFLEDHERKLSRYKKQQEICMDEDISPGALCSLPPPVPHDNLLSKSLRWRENNSGELTRVAHKDGRAHGYSRANIEQIRSLCDRWELEVHGLPTWKAICNYIEEFFSLTVRYASLQSNKEVSIMFDGLVARLLSNPIVKRDSSLRWHWNYNYLVSEVLKAWDYERLKSPSHASVADEINRQYPYVNITKASIEKNKATSLLVAQKKQELQDSGYLQLSSRGRVLSERDFSSETDDEFNVYEAFDELCLGWTLDEGLPTKDLVLSALFKKTGFNFSFIKLNNNQRLSASFKLLQARFLRSEYVVYNSMNRPAWNVYNLIEGCLRDVGVDDVDKLYNAVCIKFKGFKMSRPCFYRYASAYRRGVNK